MNSNRHCGHIKYFGYPLLTFVTLSVLVWFTLAGGQQPGSPKSPRIQLDERSKARQIVSGKVLGNFESSLMVREDADFLLTPALLVQEAISEKVVVTYPAE